MRGKRMALIGVCVLLLVVFSLPVLGGLADGVSTSEAKIGEKVYVLNKNAGLWPKKEAKGEALVKKVGIAYAVKLVERDGAWTKVELLDGTQGYMHTYYLGGLYKIKLGERVYAMREKQDSREKFSTVAFDRSSGEDLIVLFEDGNWFYVIETRDGIGGYIPKNVKHEIIEYP